MLRNIKPSSTLLLIALLAASGVASARSSDRKQPMDIDAGHSVCDSSGQTTCNLSQKVTVTQGTLRIDSDTAVITQAGDKPSRAKFSGGVVLRQEMDDGTQLNAKSSTLDYDMKTETIVFTGNVSIQQDRGTLSGERVVYNVKTGQIESGGSGNGRVKMRIIPKDAEQGTP